MVGLYTDDDSPGWDPQAVDRSQREASTPHAGSHHRNEADAHSDHQSRTSSKSIDAVQRRREQNRLSQMARR